MAPECIYIPKKSQHTLQHTKSRNERQSRNGRINLNCWTVSILAGIIITNYIEKPIVKYGLKNSILKLLELIHLRTPQKKHSPLQRVNKVHN